MECPSAGFCNALGLWMALGVFALARRTKKPWIAALVAAALPALVAAVLVSGALVARPSPDLRGQLAHAYTRKERARPTVPVPVRVRRCASGENLVKFRRAFGGGFWYYCAND